MTYSTKLAIALTCICFGTACVAEEPHDDAAPTKQELAEQLASGKADTNIDWCAEFDWYGDGICDDFCASPDPDCASDDYDPCAGAACGDSCSVCPPGDADCFETAVVKMCQADGSCGATTATCEPEPYEPCAGLTCGESCSICDPSDADCFETAVVKMCQADGTCGSEVATCDPEPYEPCEGLACGEECSVCDPADADCVETAVLKYCQADGSCAGAVPNSCDATGDYDPCGGLACGDTCTLCDPSDADCFETQVIKICDADGACSASNAVCQ